MKTISVTKARQDLFNLMNETILSNEPVQITGKNGNVILLSESDWRSIQETLHLLSIPGMRESIITGMETPVEECLEEVDWKSSN